MSKIQETTLEINLQKLKHNFEFIKSNLNESTKVLAVVKAFAYGNDAEAIASHLQDLNVDYFAVAYTHEGIQLRKSGIRKPIIVLHPQPTNFKALVEASLEPNLYNFRVLNKFISIAAKLDKNNYPVHIKFNTGLNRLGFNAEDVEKITTLTNTSKSIEVISIFSHLAASEDLNEKEFTHLQIDRFTAIKKYFEEKSNNKPFAHLANTSGILNYPEAHFDMVRSGIGLYGFGNDKRFNDKLKPIASLKTIISQINHIKPGETLGYNRAFKATTAIKTATLPIGHADGISRQFGNGKGFVTIKNQKAFILGNVCMDMIMVDVTNIDCEEGDEVIIYDGQHTASEFAKTANTISYEIITATSRRVKRTFYR